MLSSPILYQIADGVTEDALREVFSKAGIVDRALIMPKDPTLDYPCRDALVTFRTPEYAHRAVGKCRTPLGRLLFGSPEPAQFATRTVPLHSARHGRAPESDG